MPKHRSKKSNPLSNMLRQVKVRSELLWRRLPGKQIKARFASLLQGKHAKAVSEPAKTPVVLSARQADNRTTPVTRSRSYSSKRRRVFRIKNIRRVLVAAGALAVVIIGVVLAVTLTGGKQQTVAQADSLASAPEMSTSTVPDETKLASISVVTPVYESVRITQGTTAAVVGDVQGRLMELGYMDSDEPDSIFGNQTAAAVNHFKTQHGLEANGIVDEQTYSLLFSDQAQYYTITIGAEDNDVYDMQQRLMELGYMDTATGYFGKETEAAVKKFQKLNNIEQDGKIGQGTREMLYSTDVVANIYAPGEHSDKILNYQKRLKKLGYLMTEPDGSFGKDTKEAVQRFQEANGIIADGYIGPATAGALMSSEAQSSALSVGSRSSQVTTVQERLKKLGYMSRVTGYFGEDTESAVRKFQKRNGLSQDGRVGPNTLNVLMSSSAKKASTGSSSGSSSGSHSGGSNSGGSNSGGSNSGGSNSGSGSTPNITGANVESFLSVAESKLGKEYTRGAKGPNEFDCSGFVYWCLKQVGVNQSYMTSYTWRSTTKYTRIENMSDLKRGDVIVYKGHVAICAGNGVMVDASSSNDKVVKRKYTGSSYWSRNFICGYRIF